MPPILASRKNLASGGVESSVLVEIWSDVVCPWCYIGKRRFEEALERFEGRDDVEVVWRSFELDPDAPAVGVDVLEHLATKYGVSLDEARGMHERVTQAAAGVGLEYHLDRTQRGNSFDAHRLLHLAKAHGLQGELKERLFRAYFTDGEPIGDPATLRKLATEVGLTELDVDDVLGSDRFADDVHDDERTARELGCRGVPFFVVDRRLGVAGAQDPQVLVGMLEQATG